MALVVDRDKPLDLGPVFADLQRLAKARGGTYLLVTGATMAPGALLSVVANGVVLYAMSLKDQEPEQMATLMIIGVSLLFVAIAVLAFLSFFGQAAVCYLSLEELAGRSRTVGEAFAVAGRRFIPLSVLSFLVGTLVLLGMLLCIAPGVILSLIFYVAIPALMVEQLGPIEAMRRSSELTGGHRVAAFLLTLVVGALSIGVAVAGGIVAAPFNAFGSLHWSIPLVGVVIQQVVGVVAPVVAQLAQSVAYMRLRQAKDGIDTAQLAEVFR